MAWKGRSWRLRVYDLLFMFTALVLIGAIGYGAVRFLAGVGL